MKINHLFMLGTLFIVLAEHGDLGRFRLYRGCWLFPFGQGAAWNLGILQPWLAHLAPRSQAVSSRIYCPPHPIHFPKWPSGAGRGGSPWCQGRPWNCVHSITLLFSFQQFEKVKSFNHTQTTISFHSQSPLCHWFQLHIGCSVCSMTVCIRVAAFYLDLVDVSTWLTSSIGRRKIPESPHVQPTGVAAGQEWCSELSVVSGSTRICAKPEVIWNKSQILQLMCWRNMIEASPVLTAIQAFVWHD